MIYFMLFFLGRSLVIIFMMKKNNFELQPNILFETKASIFFPIIGYFFLGNILIFLNFFIPLKSFSTTIILFFLFLINLLQINKLEVKKILNGKNYVIYFFIPLVLLVSTFDLNFHYDAAFYHLNHQNWLRESNIVVGMVNIFWPYGIGSISDYVSSIFWLEKTLINIHYLSIVFLSVFLSFIYLNISGKTKTSYTYPLVFIIIFSLLDNFGYNGGRNGFLYIQELGKQDLEVAVLVILIGLITVNLILKKLYSPIEFKILMSFSLLSYQLKLSSLFIFSLIIFYIAFLLFHKLVNLKELFFGNIYILFFSIFWFIKNFLNSGCIIFPINITCYNNLSWYRDGSTKYIEDYTSQTSFGLQSYLKDGVNGIEEWFKDFFYLNDPFSSFYRGYYLNFFISFLAIILLKIFFTKFIKFEKHSFVLIVSFCLFAITYLTLYGPIPRYSSGILTLIVGLIGINIVQFKKYNSIYLFQLLFVLSLLLIPRLNSYKSAFINQNIALPDPRFEWNYDEKKLNDQWISPIGTDICWINLYCTSEVGGELILVEGYFKIVSRELD